MMARETRERLRDQLIRHEGIRLRPYYDTTHHLTVGVGRNIEAVGISKDEALYLLSNDMDTAILRLTFYKWFPDLDEVRQAALVNFMFNVGWKTFEDFTHMIASLERQDYEAAARQMLDSLWAEQVGTRATELSAQLRTGEWQDVA